MDEINSGNFVFENKDARNFGDRKFQIQSFTTSRSSSLPPLSDLFSLLFAVVLRAHLQQLRQHLRVQEWRHVRDQQEEPHGVQGVPAAKMPDGRDVEVGLAVRAPLQLVQDPLSAAGADERKPKRDAGNGFAVRARFPTGIPPSGTAAAGRRGVQGREGPCLT